MVGKLDLVTSAYAERGLSDSYNNNNKGHSMRCFYCKDKLPKEAESDICDLCLFHVDDTERDYDDDVQRDIEAVVNKTGLTPARYIE